MIEEFFKIAANLKSIPRQGWIDKIGISSPESVADHVYSTSVMAMVLGDILNLNSEKLLKMSLLHDLSESVVGDITPEKISKGQKTRIENNTMKKILLQLPKQLQDDYLLIWNEFLQNDTVESKLLHEIDKLEMALQAVIYSTRDDYSLKTFQIFLNTANAHIQSPELKKIFNSLIESNLNKK